MFEFCARTLSLASAPGADFDFDSGYRYLEKAPVQILKFDALKEPCVPRVPARVRRTGFRVLEHGHELHNLRNIVVEVEMYMRKLSTSVQWR